MLSAIVVMLCVIVPQLAVLIIACVAALGKSMHLINRVNRQLKRLSNNAVAPVVTNVAEAERGRDVARAAGCEDFFVRRQRGFVDAMMKANFMENALQNVSLLAAQLWCLVIIASIALVILVAGVVPPTLAPIALAYAVIVPHSGQV